MKTSTLASRSSLLAGIYFGKVCGLLGTNNYEHIDDILSPQGSPMNSTQELTESWIVSQGKCDYSKNFALDPMPGTIPRCKRVFRDAESPFKYCFYQVNLFFFSFILVNTDYKEKISFSIEQRNIRNYNDLLYSYFVISNLTLYFFYSYHWFYVRIYNFYTFSSSSFLNRWFHSVNALQASPSAYESACRTITADEDEMKTSCAVASAYRKICAVKGVPTKIPHDCNQWEHETNLVLKLFHFLQLRYLLNQYFFI